MNRLLVSAVVPILLGLVGTNALGAIVLEGLTDSNASGEISGYASDINGELWSPPATGGSRLFSAASEIRERGFELLSNVSSEIHFAPNSSTIVSVSAYGDSHADMINGLDDVAYTQSFYITNFKFYIDTPVEIDWQYEATGVGGPLGTSDGIDIRLKIREFADESYAADAIIDTVTNQFFGAGTSSQSFLLAPGYYDLVTQGRVLFNKPNAVNRDGSSQWSYQYTLTSAAAVPEPASFAMWSLLGVFGYITVRRRQRRMSL